MHEISLLPLLRHLMPQNRLIAEACYCPNISSSLTAMFRPHSAFGADAGLARGLCRAGAITFKRGLLIDLGHARVLDHLAPFRHFGRDKRLEFRPRHRAGFSTDLDHALA